MSKKEDLLKHLINIPGPRSRRRQIVIESDDWGTIRTSSKEAYQKLLSKGYKVDDCPYNTYDSLENNEDMEALFNVLMQFRDHLGNHPVLTANTIVANPDFKRIKEAGYETYFYEPFFETLSQYPFHDKVAQYYAQGIALNIFRPQFHGREHVNVRRWLSSLRSGNVPLRDAFEHNMFTLHVGGASSGRREFLDSFGGSTPEEQNSYRQVLEEGLGLFHKLLGYRSETFIAPCYTWPVAIEPMLKELGVKFIQGTHVQRIPQDDNTLAIKKKYHFMGQRNKLSQKYLLRNAFFEPSENPRLDNVDSCLKQIAVAFKWGKPAVISSHRLNYMGGLRRENREKNLAALSTLFNRVIKAYPDVEFTSSDALMT